MTLELVGVVSLLLMATVCFRHQADGAKTSVLVFWAGITFFFIGVIRTLGIFGLIDLADSRMAIGLFYPFVLITALLDMGWGRGLIRKAKNDH